MRDLVQEMDDLSDEEGELEDIVRVFMIVSLFVVACGVTMVVIKDDTDDLRFCFLAEG